MRNTLITLVVFLLACLAACDPGNSTGVNSAVTGKPRVYAVNYPLAWAVVQLAGEFVEVGFPAPEGIDPAFWEPDLETIAAYQQAELILLNGANYAKWTGKVSLPRNRLIDTSKEFADQYITVDSGPLHSHGPGGEHSHGEVAFTIWLDLSLYARQVESIASALARLLPDHAADIEQRQEKLLGRLLELDQQLLQAGQALNGAPVLYSHPVYQYLQARYGLNGAALHWEPDQVPKASDWAQLDALLSRHPARLMLWEAEPAPATREALASRGIAIVVFSPRGNGVAGEDFAQGLRQNTGKLIESATTLARQGIR